MREVTARDRAKSKSRSRSVSMECVEMPMTRRDLLSLGAAGALGLTGARSVHAAAPAAALAPPDPPPGAVASAAPPAATGPWVHAWAPFNEPKYAKGFGHFDFADPMAVKGGTLYLSNPDRRTSFDKFNPYTIKGQSPGGLVIYMFETLTVPSGDEPSTVYGLLAEEMSVAPDRSSVSFRLHPKARFWNGDPVLASDVKHSFEMLTSKYAYPSYRTAFAVADRAVVVDERTVRFDLNNRTIDAVGAIASQLPVFSAKWGVGADGKRKNFDEIISEHPITSGPYTIAATDSGRRIEFKLRPDYWARDLGVRRGFFNFERVVYRYYKDRAVSMEAFKAGEFDLNLEYSARRWDRQHAGAKWDDGRIKKENFPSGMGAGMQAYLFNLRRPIFQDRRLREAMDWAFDFEWINRLRQYQRTYSLFSNSEFAAQGLPSAGELRLLEPFRAQLPAEVFGLPYVPPRTDTSATASRDNLRHARDLLNQAGWKLGADGLLHDAQGRVLEFEYLTSEDGAERTVAVWQSNLLKLGVRMKTRRVDFALYRKRLEVFDYDLVAIRMPDFTLPSALDYVDTFGSKAADEEGSNNFRGTKSPAADAIVAAMGRAQTFDEVRDACRALDRVVMFERWQVPELYGANFRVSYWDRFERPKTVPRFYTIDSPNESLPQWPIINWWLKPEARR